jgi:hypothetical protein
VPRISVIAETSVVLSVNRHALCVNYVAPRGVSMVCRLFVISGVMMFGGFPWWRAAEARSSIVADGTGTDYAHLHSVCTDLAICLSFFSARVAQIPTKFDGTFEGGTQ